MRQSERVYSVSLFERFIECTAGRPFVIHRFEAVSSERLIDVSFSRRQQPPRAPQQYSHGQVDNPMLLQPNKQRDQLC